MFNVKLFWDLVDDCFGVVIWVKNIENNDELLYLINLQGGFGYDYYVVGLLCRVGLDFSYCFQKLFFVVCCLLVLLVVVCMWLVFLI